MRVGFLHSLIRKEEKLLIEEFKKHDGVELVMMDDRRLIFDLHSKPDVDVVIDFGVDVKHLKISTSTSCPFGPQNGGGNLPALPPNYKTKLEDQNV